MHPQPCDEFDPHSMSAGRENSNCYPGDSSGLMNAPPLHAMLSMSSADAQSGSGRLPFVTSPFPSLSVFVGPFSCNLGTAHFQSTNRRQTQAFSNIEGTNIHFLVQTKVNFIATEETDPHWSKRLMEMRTLCQWF